MREIQTSFLILQMRELRSRKLVEIAQGVTSGPTQHPSPHRQPLWITVPLKPVWSINITVRSYPFWRRTWDQCFNTSPETLYFLCFPAPPFWGNIF